MGILDNVVKRFTGKVSNKKTQQVVWNDEITRYTSSFLLAVHSFIAREFSKLEIEHRIYTRLGDSTGIGNKYGSSIYEVLEYNPNGFRTNREWKRAIILKLVQGQDVYLLPRYNGPGDLISLTFTDKEMYLKNPDDVVVITTPFTVSRNVQLYDEMLTSIGEHLRTNKVKAFLSLNTQVANGSDFNEKVQSIIKNMQEVGSYNGIGFLDAKTKLEELKHEYSPIGDGVEEIIKRELLNGFGLSEKLLRGEYTNTDYRNFFETVLRPVIDEIETEFTYKLLTTNARVNRPEKQSFERITISYQTLDKFASPQDLTRLMEANTNGAYLKVNEVRQLLGYDPVEGGDVFRTNLNSTEVQYGENKNKKDDGVKNE